MDLLIRLLVISFPIVFAGALFWPVIHDRYVKPEPITEESKLDDFLIFPEDNTTPRTKQLPRKVRPVEDESYYESDSGIYRWVDEDGRVMFSDRPTNKKAVAHTPIDIGHISAANLQRPQRVVAVANSKIVKKTSVTQPSSRHRPDFKYSNTTARQESGYIQLTGRISSGYKCKQLRVTATAKSERGRTVWGQDIVSHNGFGSCLYDIKIRSSWRGKGSRPRWNPQEVSIRCLD